MTPSWSTWLAGRVRELNVFATIDVISFSVQAYSEPMKLEIRRLQPPGRLFETNRNIVTYSSVW
jgi:hypothetical protein